MLSTPPRPFVSAGSTLHPALPRLCLERRSTIGRRTTGGWLSRSCWLEALHIKHWKASLGFLTLLHTGEREHGLLHCLANSVLTRPATRQQGSAGAVQFTGSSTDYHDRDPVTAAVSRKSTLHYPRGQFTAAHACQLGLTPERLVCASASHATPRAVSRAHHRCRTADLA